MAHTAMHLSSFGTRSGSLLHTLSFSFIYHCLVLEGRVSGSSGAPRDMSGYFDWCTSGDFHPHTSCFLCLSFWNISDLCLAPLLISLWHFRNANTHSALRERLSSSRQNRVFLLRQGIRGGRPSVGCMDDFHHEPELLQLVYVGRQSRSDDLPRVLRIDSGFAKCKFTSVPSHRSSLQVNWHK